MLSADVSLAPTAAAGPRPLVRLRDVHLSFGATPVLKGIDLDVFRGQAVSIIGPSGSGKSTILRCVTGLLRPQYGEVEVDGTRVDQLASERDEIELRKRVGFVFQQYNLFPASERTGQSACRAGAHPGARQSRRHSHRLRSAEEGPP